MVHRRALLCRRTFQCHIFTVLSFFLVIIYCLLTLLPPLENEIKSNSGIEGAIYRELHALPAIYMAAPQAGPRKVEEFLWNIKRMNNFTLKDANLWELWSEANAWPSSIQLINVSSVNIGKLLYALKHAGITRADIDSRGTQLKLLLNLTDHQQCVFKPKWYSKDRYIDGPVFAGKDRYGSEIIAFYLSILLEKPLTPISVERTISLKYDILPIATERLINTSFERDGRTCIYGKCYYCKKDDPICDNELNFVTGAMIFNIKRTFSNYRSPWQRTYTKNKQAHWENDPNFCKVVKTRLTRNRLFDLIDTAIFDFLIQNGDRHHYETLDNTVVWLDNGKGFGNPYVQHLDVLAPLYQCCIVREKTWNALLNLSGGNLSKYLKLMPDIHNFLAEPHFKAIDERLLLIFATVEYCKKKRNGI